MALIVFAIWININNPAYPGLELLADPALVLIIAIVLTLIMNLPIPFIKFSFGREMNIHQIFSLILILIGIALLFINWRLSVLFFILTFFLFSLFFILFHNLISFLYCFKLN